MRIQNGTPRSSLGQSSLSQPVAAGTVPSFPAAGQTSVLMPSSEWLSLLDGLRQQPEIRADVLSAVSGRVESGELLTSAASARTAEAILANAGPGTASPDPAAAGGEEPIVKAAPPI